MAHANNRGVRIHYESEGSGPALLLQHGFMQSAADWYECGYVDALKSHYRLILVDARGHGRSDKPRDFGAYSFESTVGDVIAVLDALDIQKADFWGYSAGARTGFGLAHLAPERFNHLVLGGQHPYDCSMEGYRRILQSSLEQGPDSFLWSLELVAGTLPPGYKTRLREADFEAFLAAAQDRPGMEHALPKFAIPCCLYAGDADPVFKDAKSASDLIANATFFSLPRLSHLQAFVRSDLVLPRVVSFLQSR